MSRARIAPIEPPYPPELQAEFDKVMRGAPPLLLFRTVARNPRVLQRFLAASLLDRGSISLRSRELMILRTCALCKAEYEWGVHIAAFGGKAGWTQEQIEATVSGTPDNGCWSAEERAILILADELHRNSDVGDGAWHQATAHFSAEQLVELVMLAGLYHAVSYMANAFGVQHEESAPRFPHVA
jgi:alkylhydroperoxidase family enzyme